MNITPRQPQETFKFKSEIDPVTRIIHPGMEGTLGSLLDQSPKSDKNLFLYVGLTTVGTSIEF